MATKHNHGPNYGRRVQACPRCDELANGAPAVQWFGTRRAAEEARTLAAIRAHDCTLSNCGPVCTAFDW